jgi:pimeloyl-ACP methyl ester carboxylesterase
MSRKGVNAMINFNPSRRTTIAALAAASAFALINLGGPTLAFAPESKSLTVGENSLVYLKSGTGPALVIIHGIGGHKEDWQGVMEAMSSTHTVYAVDMLGFGGSTRAAKDLSMKAQSDAVLALLKSEGVEKADILGNSVGGWVAATFAAANPANTNKLIVVDPAGFKAMFEGQPPVNIFPDDAAQMKKLLEFVRFDKSVHTDEVAMAALEGLNASGEKTIQAVLWPALGGSPKLEEVMPNIKAPTLVIWGKEDKLFPVALAPYITSLTPGATSVVIANASHFPHLDNPTEFGAAVSGFLK